MTHVRISLKTKRLLVDLKQKHGFATTDQVLRYYLPSNVAENKPVFHTAKEIYELTKQRSDIDRMIKDTSKQIMRSINKSEQNQSKDKLIHKTTWRKKRDW